MPHFTEITPLRTSRPLKSKKWKFMVYIEFPFERKDQRRYHALLFRDKDRTLYGIKEYWDDEIPSFEKLRVLANKVVSDSEFRKSLLSDNSDLPLLWKRH